MEKLKPEIKTVQKNGLLYTKKNQHLIHYTPWLGNSFSFMYDFMMNNRVFPKTFGANIEKHNTILNQMLTGVHQMQVLELATGTGNAVQYLNNDNHYTGVDVSPELLKKASKRLRSAGFNNPELYVVSADDLPFQDQTFDVCLCILALNFFSNAEPVFREVERILVPGGMFVCSVPVPERNKLNTFIQGTLYSEKELHRLSQMVNCKMESTSDENGPLLYFTATKV